VVRRTATRSDVITDEKSGIAVGGIGNGQHVELFVRLVSTPASSYVRVNQPTSAEHQLWRHVCDVIVGWLQSHPLTSSNTRALAHCLRLNIVCFDRVTNTDKTTLPCRNEIIPEQSNVSEIMQMSRFSSQSQRSVDWRQCWCSNTKCFPLSDTVSILHFTIEFNVDYSNTGTTVTSQWRRL